MKPNRRKFSRIAASLGCEIQSRTRQEAWQGRLTTVGFGGASCQLTVGIPLQERYQLLCPGLPAHALIAMRICWIAPAVESGRIHAGFDFDLGDAHSLADVSQLLFRILQAAESRQSDASSSSARTGASCWCMTAAVEKDGRTGALLPHWDAAPV